MEGIVVAIDRETGTIHAQKGDLVHGTVQHFEGGAAIVTLGKSDHL